MSDRNPTGDLDAAEEGLAPLITETVVRATLSEEENALTRDHHLGSHAHADSARMAGLEAGDVGPEGTPAQSVTGELDRAVEPAVSGSGRS